MLTSSLAINIGDFALNNGGVQETLVRNTQALGGLVLVTFTRFLWGSYRFERSCGHCVVENPIDCVSAHGHEGQIGWGLTGCCKTFQYGCQER